MKEIEDIENSQEEEEDEYDSENHDFEDQMDEDGGENSSDDSDQELQRIDGKTTAVNGSSSSSSCSAEKFGGSRRRVEREQALVWVECSSCKKWRVWKSGEKPPEGDWLCSDNSWDSFNSCEVPQQKEY